ncbi:RagB/SusD family nutrient uptake outer membrane protein [Butyricimonas virosa]|uniref:RagB/SusD family nutrient uptake outer membrane protein n=1 Tax=Butyricimonas virosa TaxID=544645 RepID=UPI003A8728F6
MKYIISFLTILFFCSACEEYLDLVPEKDIETFGTIFETRKGADQWITTIYSGLQNKALAGPIEAPGVSGADEFIASEYIRDQTRAPFYIAALKIGDGLQMSQEPLCAVWTDDGVYKYIRMCNTFLDRIGGVYDIEKVERDYWIAEVKAVKAFFYFELVKRYGPIVLVPENIGVGASIEEMKQPRSHVDTCFKAITNLLDEAIPDLLPNGQRPFIRKNYFCKESALALKARVLLYAASPLFNGNEFYGNFRNKNGELLFNSTYDPEKWRLAAEAADEAVAECERGGYSLVSERANRNTKLLNVMDNIEWSTLVFNHNNTESIFSVLPVSDYSFAFLLPNNDGQDPLNLGVMGPSMKMVEMFYTENGLPIDNDKTWDYAGRYQLSKEKSTVYKDVVLLDEDVLALHLRREPRFYADIAADRCYWRRGPKVNMSGYEVKAYRGESFGLRESRLVSTIPQNICGYWVKKMTCSDVETFLYSMNMPGEQNWPIIRLAELYLIQAEAWNEYEGPLVDKKHVYGPLNKVRVRAGIPDVETSWISYSNTPDKVKTKEGMREIIRREINIEFAFEGHRFWNLRRWKEAHKELNSPLKGWNVLGENARSFYNNFEGPIEVWGKAKFISPRDYLFPIKSEEVLVTGCVQNPGW